MNMYIAVDETGEFSDSGSKKFGLVTLVSATDASWKKFQEYLAIELPSAFTDMKGNNISFVNREKILKYLCKHTEIRYTCFVYDLNLGNVDLVNSHKKRQIGKIDSWICKHVNANKSLIEDLRLLHNQIGNLSISDYAKFFFITELFIHWERYFLFDYESIQTSRDSWEMHHVIDTQVKPEKFKRIVKNTIKLTANTFNPDFQMYTPKSWEPTHPYLVNQSVEGNTLYQDGNKFFSDFKIGTEQEDLILFLPDLIGNTIYRSILFSHQIRWLKILKRLKANRSSALTKSGYDNCYYLIRGFSGAMHDTKIADIFITHSRLMGKL